MALHQASKHDRRPQMRPLSFLRTIRGVPSTCGKAGRIRHANEFMVDHRIADFERLVHDRAQPVRVGMVSDSQKCAVDEPVRTDRKRRAGNRQGEGLRQHAFDVHGFFAG
jgi:hypothetical protein